LPLVPWLVPFFLASRRWGFLFFSLLFGPAALFVALASRLLAFVFAFLVACCLGFSPLFLLRFCAAPFVAFAFLRSGVVCFPPFFVAAPLLSASAVSLAGQMQPALPAFLLSLFASLCPIFSLCSEAATRE